MWRWALGLLCSIHLDHVWGGHHILDLKLSLKASVCVLFIYSVFVQYKQYIHQFTEFFSQLIKTVKVGISIRIRDRDG